MIQYFFFFSTFPRMAFTCLQIFFTHMLLVSSVNNMLVSHILDVYRRATSVINVIVRYADVQWPLT